MSLGPIAKLSLLSFSGFGVLMVEIRNRSDDQLRAPQRRARLSIEEKSQGFLSVAYIGYFCVPWVVILFDGVDPLIASSHRLMINKL